MKKTLQFIASICLLLTVSSLYGITASEVFNDGKRAYSMGNYTESKEIFARFSKTWPTHKLAQKADFYKTICIAKTMDSLLKKHSEDLVKQLKENLAKLEKDYSPTELSEVKLAILHANKQGNKFSWEELKSTASDDLMKILQNGWHTSPSLAPIKTLEFIKFWEINSSANSAPTPELKAKICHIKSLALWQLLLSPLSLDANARILKEWGYLPVHNTLDKSLSYGFSHGDIEQKKKIALLGFHFDCFRHKGIIQSRNLSDLKSRWLTYLTERGINFQEAWCPR